LFSFWHWWYTCYLHFGLSRGLPFVGAQGADRGQTLGGIIGEIFFGALILLG
jgi:hypothetical protein